MFEQWIAVGEDTFYDDEEMQRSSARKCKTWWLCFLLVCLRRRLWTEFGSCFIWY